MSELERNYVHFAGVSLNDFHDLPVATRLLDRLTAALVLADEILSDLTGEDVASLQWIEVHARRIYDEADAAITRLGQ